MTSAVDLPEVRKARGAFFTPPALARYVAAWAIRSPADAVMEPSCGEAAFLLAAGRRLRDLGARDVVLHGHELHPPSAQRAAQLLHESGFAASVAVGDFFEQVPVGSYDAVVGNPPYVRYQDFSGIARTRSRAAALRAGVNLTGLASSWAAFTVHSALFLRPGGRLALVLPGELLTVNYAAEVRSFLMRRFGRVRLVVFKERVFPGVLEEVVLLLAEGEGGTDSMELLQFDDVGALERLGSVPVTSWTPRPTEGKWTRALLPVAALDTLDGVVGNQGVHTLRAWGETTLGAVTGNNGFFAMRSSLVQDLGIPRDDLVRLSPPGSRHLRGLDFTDEAWEELRGADAPVWLWHPAGEPLSPASQAYRRSGETDGVDRAYKCRVRAPWWRVPTLAPADLLVTYMNADSPRLTSNLAGVRHLNSVHGVYLRAGVRDLGRRLLPLAALNSLTLLGAETVGRSYGGGLLKLEPKEADVLPLPSPAVVALLAERLEALRPDIRLALERGGLLAAVRLVDPVVLVEGLGLSQHQVDALEAGRQAMAGRRKARGRAPAGGH